MAANTSNSNLNLADKLDTLVKKLGDTAESIRKTGGASFDHKVTVTTAAQDILQTVQEPVEHLMGSMVMLVQFTATRLFVKWKVFETIPLQGLISYKELAEKVGADEALISRSTIPVRVAPANICSRTFCLDIGRHGNPPAAGSRPSRAH